MKRSLITILIAARNRPAELARTLAELRRQTYRPLELLVIDDASDASLEPVVREFWPEARFVRHKVNAGLIASRSEGMRLASGDFVCSLDDDSCFVEPEALERAMARLEGEPEVGIVTFLVHHGEQVPDADAAAPAECYVAAYIGCGHMIRRAVIDAIGGYRDFYFYYGEESEYSLRALAAGWRILFYPAVAVHHRVSRKGRNQSRVFGYSLRNHLFTILLHMSWRRALAEGSWKLASYGLDAVRRLEWRSTLWALRSLAAHWGEVRALRRPVSAETLRRYDALRFTAVDSAELFERPPAVGWAHRLNWFRDIWWHRRRARASWDRRPGGIGASTTSVFDGVAGSGLARGSEPCK